MKKPPNLKVNVFSYLSDQVRAVIHVLRHRVFEETFWESYLYFDCDDFSHLSWLGSYHCQMRMIFSQLLLVAEFLVWPTAFQAQSFVRFTTSKFRTLQLAQLPSLLFSSLSLVRPFQLIFKAAFALVGQGQTPHQTHSLCQSAQLPLDFSFGSPLRGPTHACFACLGLVFLFIPLKGWL